MRASWPATSASGGPSSTRTRARGVSSSTESPWPTSRNVTRSPAGRFHAGVGRVAIHAVGDESDAGRDASPRPLAAATRDAAVRWRTTSHATAEPIASASAASDVRLVRAGRSATTRATSSSQAAAQPASAASPAAADGRDGIDDRGQEPEPEHERRGRRTRATFAGTVYTRRLAEVEEDDRRGREAAGERDGERLGDAARERIAVEPAPDARNGDEDRGDRGERELEARARAATSASTPGARARRRARKCQRSRGRAASQASDASAPATPARTTDGCQPTASTYAAITPSVASSRSDSRKPEAASRARRCPPARNATFCPETASRW